LPARAPSASAAPAPGEDAQAEHFRAAADFLRWLLEKSAAALSMPQAEHRMATLWSFVGARFGSNSSRSEFVIER